MADEKDDFLVSMMQTAPETEEEEAEEAPESEEQEQTGEEEQQAPAAEEAPPEQQAQTQAPPAAQPHREPETVPLAAVMEERRKRQALEKQLAELQAKPQPLTDFYQDPERHIADVVGRTQQAMQQQVYAALEYAAKQTYPDFDEKFAVVEEYAKNNPAALADVFASPNPAVAAYQLGKKLIEYREMQDPEQYRSKVEAELRQKLEAEYAAREKQRQEAAAAEAAKAAAIPPDLSTSASASNTKAPARKSDVFTQLFPS